MPASNERNRLLNFIKGIGCIGVVFIHVTFPGIFGCILSEISNFAVPVFFMTAGYYLEKSDKGIKHKIKKIVHILIYSVSIYSIYSIISNIKNDSFEQWIVLWKRKSVWIKIILFGNFEILDAGILWFLTALIYSYMACLIFDRLKIKKNCYILISILICIRVIVCAFVETRGLDWCFKCFFLISGLPYILIGNYIANNKLKIGKIKNQLVVILAFGGMMFSLVWVIWSYPVDLSQIGTIVFSVALFIIAVNNPNVSLNQGIEILGDKLSLYVYVLHILVAAGVDFVAGSYGKNELFLWTRPVIVVLISILLAVIITKLKRICKMNKNMHAK